MSTLTVQDQFFTDYSDWHRDYHRDVDFYAVLIDQQWRPFESLTDKEVFVYGKGWRKIGKKKVIEVPTFGKETDANSYLKEYGSHCLFYALTSENLDTSYNKCCWRNQHNDFAAMLELGIDRWRSLMEDFHALSSLVEQVYRDKYGISPDERKYLSERSHGKPFMPKIRHYVFYPFRGSPHFDPIEDERALICSYVHCFLDGDFSRYLDELDSCNLPISVKDKMVFLFGEEVAERYEKLMSSL